MTSLRSALLVAAAMLFVACTGGDSGDDDAAASGDPSSTTEAAADPADPQSSDADAGSSETAPGPPELPVTPSEAELEAQMLRWLGDGPGGVVVAQRTGSDLVFAAAGAADDAGTPMTVDRRFRVAGLTKLVVATMVLIEVEAGTIALDEPLATYLPDLAGETGITVRHLLEETSGLPDFTRGAIYNESVFTTRDREWATEEVLSLISAMPAQSAPGDRYAYSNANYVTLGFLLEEVRGKPLNELLAERITDQLDMTDTFFAGVDGPDDNVVDGWSSAGGGWIGQPFTSIATSIAGAGALVSTADDMVRFVEALFDGEIIGDALLAEMTEAEGDGFGMALRPVPFVAGEGFAQSGSIPGFAALGGARASADETVVILANRDDIDPQLLAVDLLIAEN